MLPGVLSWYVFNFFQEDIKCSYDWKGLENEIVNWNFNAEFIIFKPYDIGHDSEKLISLLRLGEAGRNLPSTTLVDQKLHKYFWVVSKFA